MILSIITINFNNLEGLKKTIESVSKQSSKDFEYIVIDGGSTDGSKEYIENKQSDIDFWVSEKDSGIYNAMNKGILQAKGKYLMFLNSGDWLYDNNVIKNKILLFNTNKDIYYGNYKIHTNEKIKNGILPIKITFNYLFRYSLCHPASFIKRELFSIYGLYNETNKIVSDWEFFIVCIAKYNCSLEYINDFICHYDFNGISSVPENLDKCNNERKQVLENHFPYFIDDYLNITKLNDKRSKQFLTIKESKYGYKILKLFMNIIIPFVKKV